MRNPRFRKPAYTPLAKSDPRFWGNNLDPSKKEGIKTHITSFQDDMKANDKLPEMLRNAVNNTPNIKWSSVKVLEALEKSRIMFPFLTEEQLIVQLVDTIMMKDKQAGEKLNNGG